MESAFAVYKKNQPKDNGQKNKKGKNNRNGITKAKNRQKNNEKLKNAISREVNGVQGKKNASPKNRKNENALKKLKQETKNVNGNSNAVNNTNANKNAKAPNINNKNAKGASINNTNANKNVKAASINNTNANKNTKAARTNNTNAIKTMANINVNTNALQKGKNETKQNTTSKAVKQKHVKRKQMEDDEEVPQLIEFPMDIPTSSGGLMDGEFHTKGASLLKWLLFPVTPEVFFNDYWETGPLHIKRDYSDYYKDLLTTRDIDVMLREHPLYFGRNVDIVSYKDGKRVTENPAGRAKASIVLNAYSEGYSVRILNPQTYNHKVHLILATLQEYFGTMVGVNVYLTPAGTQGFAPHYDDIEAFVIQLEGRKHWKLYKSKDENDSLARFSSKDYDRSELGEMIGEFTLNAGSILYFPRGVVHEAKTDDEMHSLHLTISTHQRTAFADLLEKALPLALERAATNDIEFRRNLPLDYLKHLGRVNSDVDTPERKALIDQSKQLMKKLWDHISLDDAADQMGKKFMHDCLPPVLSVEEQQRTSRLDGERLLDGNLFNRSEIEPDTEVRLLRYYAIRLVYEEDEYRLYYCTENAKVYHGEEEQFIAIEDDSCPMIEVLLNAYPKYVKVDDLPHDDITKKISLVTELWDYGIIVTKEVLEVTGEEMFSDSDSFDESDIGEVVE